MRRFFASPFTSAATGAVVALLAAGGGYALASGAGTIKACAAKHSHALYLGRCKKGDKRLSWSQRGPRGARGATGVTGATGPQGSAGAPGAPGANGATHVTVRTAETSANSGAQGMTVASCNADEVAVGGGANVTAGSASQTSWFEPGGVPATGGSPAGAGSIPNEWLATWINGSTGTESVEVFVVCASP